MFPVAGLINYVSCCWFEYFVSWFPGAGLITLFSRFPGLITMFSVAGLISLFPVAGLITLFPGFLVLV